MSDARIEFLRSDNEAAIRARMKWLDTARYNQIPPPGNWEVIVYLAGRFFGKTRVLTEDSWYDAFTYPGIRVHALAPTIGDVRRTLYEGEALALDTPIPTPAGWCAFGDLVVGSEVFSSDGSITTVIGTTPIWHDRPCYSMSARLMSEPIVADAKHLWLTGLINQRKRDWRYGLRSTEEIAKTCRWAGTRRHILPLAAPLDTAPAAQLPIPPYTLGAWLGDGSTRGDGAYTCHPNDIAIIERIRRDGFQVKMRVGSYAWGIKKLKVLLREVGIAGNKQIPSQYLRASFSQRICLLQGLMDTDGYVSERGQCSFDNTNYRLAQQVRELLLTLGFRPGAIQEKVDKRGFETMYRVTFMVTAGAPCPFHLPRKANRVRISEREPGRKVWSVTKTKSVPVRCIQVAHPSGMFLAGRDFIPTHNSGFLAKIPPELVKNYNKSLHELTMTNGSKIIGFSATEEADRLRGPQCHRLIFDEAAAADKPAGNLETAYKVAALGCRLPYPDGTPTRKFIATTPKPIPFLRQLIKRPRTLVVRGSSYDNLANVAASVRSELLSMEGTEFGRQEIHGEILDDVKNAIFKRSWFRLWPSGKKLPEFMFLIVSLDTAMSEENYNSKKDETDYSAATVLGVFNTHQAFSELERRAMGVRSKYAALVCDFWMERLGFPELCEKVRNTTRQRYGAPAGPGMAARRPDVTVIEMAQSGISLRQVMSQYGVPTWPFNPHRQDKTMRAHAVAPFVLQGMLFVPESARPERKGLVRDWCEPLMEQMCLFAGEGSVPHDDAVDSIVQGMLYLSERGTFQLEPSERLFPDPDEKEEQEQREAARISARQKRKTESAYGA